MKIELIKRTKNPYRQRETGNLVFAYDVTGTPEELAAYKTANPKAIEDKETKRPLFFTTTFSGKEAELKKSEKGAFYPEINELEVLAEAEKTWGINIAMIVCRTGKPMKKAEAAA